MKRLLIIVSLLCLLIAGLTLTAAAANDNGGVELKHMRSEFTKVFKNADGTTTRQYWVNPIHYLGEDNQWHEIDRNVKDLAKDAKSKAKFDKDFAKLIKEAAKEEGATEQDFNKAVTNHLFQMYFPKNVKHSIQFKYEDYLFSMKPLNTQHINKQKENIKALADVANEVTYTDVWHNTDLKYEMNYNGISEFIILNSFDAERNFSFAVKAKGFELKNLESGEIAAYSLKDGQQLFTIPRPIMWDANNVYCSDVHYQLKEENNGYTLTLVYNQDYLNAPNRAFPVTIDPDIVLARNYVDEMSYVDTANPDTNYYSSTRMEVGNYKDWNFLWMGYSWEFKRGIFRFNRLTSDLGSVSDQVVVKQAKLYLDCSENKTDSTYVDVYHINYDAADWEVTKVTYNSPYSSGGYYVTPAYEDTWVYVAKDESYPRTYTCYLPTSVVSTWIHTNETKNRGLMLFDYYQGDNIDNLKKFSNAALEITLNEEIFIEASASIYPNTPQTIQFTANASSATCGTITKYSWDFDINDGVNNADTRKNPVFCYQTPGEHTYSVKATDASGHSRTYYGTVNVPALNISAYYGVTDPKTLRFVTNTNYSNTYTWSFGDASTNYIGVEGYHQYANEGTYTVQLTVTNNYGVNPLTVKKTVKYYHPVIFVHGFGDDFECWTSQIDYLRSVAYAGDLLMQNTGAADNLTGLPVHTAFNFDYYRTSSTAPQFENIGIIGTDGTVKSTTGTGTYGDQYNTITYKYSDQLRQLVEKICTSTGFDKVDIVAHSMGGLVSRAYIKYYGGTNRVDRLLTLGTPNHGIGNLETFVAKVIVKESWQRQLEVREMGYASDTFYNVSTPSTYRSYSELLNGDGQVSISGTTITGCAGNDTLGPTRYMTLAGLDNGHVSIPIADLIWEWLAPDDGVIEAGSVALKGLNVDSNLKYPGIHASSVPGNKSDLQVITKTPLVASLVNTWMFQNRTLNAVSSKPAAWVEVEKYADGTVKKFIVHTGATRTNSIWTWAMLQHEEEVATATGTEFYFSFKDYNSFWKDLSNETTTSEMLIDLSPAHYMPGDTLRVTVVTYDTTGCKVEYIPVQL